MAGKASLYGLLAFIKNDIDPETAGKLKCLLAMSNSTVISDTMPEFLAGFTTLDECDDGGYSRQTLTGVTPNVVSASRLDIDATAPTFANDGDATRAVRFIVYYIDPTGSSADSACTVVSVQQVVDKTLDGTDYTPSLPDSGLMRINA